jgi:hypothetical protein
MLGRYSLRRPTSHTRRGCLYDLNNAGIDGPRNTLLQLGYGAYTEVRQNVPRNNSIVGITGSTTLDTNDAGFLYDSPMQFLCP